MSPFKLRASLPARPSFPDEVKSNRSEEGKFLLVMIHAGATHTNGPPHISEAAQSPTITSLPALYQRPPDALHLGVSELIGRSFGIVGFPACLPVVVAQSHRVEGLIPVEDSLRARGVLTVCLH